MSEKGQLKTSKTKIQQTTDNRKKKKKKKKRLGLRLVRFASFGAPPTVILNTYLGLGKFGVSV